MKPLSSMRRLLLLAGFLLSGIAAWPQNHFAGKTLGIPGIPIQEEWIAFTDLDLDGDPDLLATWACSDALLLYVNKEGKLDSLPLVLPLPVSHKFWITDWNQDGWPDILSERNGRAFITLNLGGLALAESQELSRVTTDFSILDIDGDAYPDLYYIRPTDTGMVLRLFRNQQGTPAIELQERRLEYLSNPSGFADYNGDGLPELLIMDTRIPSADQVLIYQQSEGLQFNKVDSIPVPEPPPYTGGLISGNYLNTVDLDNDGIKEILLRNNFQARFLKQVSGYDFSYQYIGNSDSEYIIGALGQSSLLLVEDIDGNGYPDIFTDNTVFYNDQLNFTARDVYPYPHYRKWQAMADTDGDGMLDIWGIDDGRATDDFPGMTRIDYLGDQLFSTRQLVWPVHFPSAYEAYAFLDSNNDQQLDQAYSCRGDYVVLSHSDNGEYREKVIFTGGGSYQQLVPIDLNQDGLQDLLVYNSWNTGFTGRLNLGDGNFQAVAGLPGASRIVEVRDLNNDGWEDVIALQNPSEYNVRMKYFVNTEESVVFHSSYPLSTGRYRFGDFNGDGFDDFVFSADGKLKVFKNTVGEGFEELFELRIGENGVAIGWEDTNLDGQKDLIYRSESGPAGVYTRHYLGDEAFGEPVYLLPQAGSSHHLPLMLDLNNDGLKDLLTPHSVAFNRGTSFSPYEGEYDIQRYNLELLDYDLDGDQDLLFPISVCGVSVMENTVISAFRIQGAVFFDENGNGIWDGGELPVPQTKVGIENINAFVYTDTAGQFQIRLGGQDGALDITAYHPFGDYFHFTTPYPAPASISEDHPVDTILIGLQPINPLAGLLDQTISGHRCGEEGQLWINYNSITPHITQGELTLRFPESLTVTSQSEGEAPEQNGHTLRWTLGGLLPMSPDGLWTDFQMPGFQNRGDTLTFIASLKTWYEGDTLLLQDTLRTILTCAFDPNDKQIVNQEQFVQGDHLFTAQDRVEYLIRFQNTGTDTAFQVLILDNLSPVFDPASLELVSASHPFKAALSPGGFLSVEFPGIELPDSSTNFMGSMGFVKFALRLRPDAPRDQDILNGARIFFDQNPAVYTNVVDFRRVDCSHFAQVKHSSNNLRCANASYFSTAPSFGVPQAYAWYFDEEFISEKDTARYTITREGLYPLSLSVSNQICRADTTVSFNITGTYPDLGLNVNSDTSICGPLQITANQSCYWYVDGEVHHLSSSHQVYSSQHIQVSNQFGSCRTNVAFNVTRVDVPPRPLIAEGTELVFTCVGDTLVFHSLEEDNFSWHYYDHQEEMDRTTNTNPLVLPWEVLGQANDLTFLQLDLDTLNCTLSEQVPIIRQPEELELTASLQADTVWCGQARRLRWSSNVNELSLEILSLWQDGVWIMAVDPLAGDIELTQPGAYALAGRDVCASSDTAEVHLRDLNDLVPELLVTGDTLLTSTGDIVRWYSRSEVSGLFTFFSEGQRLISPPDNEYYFRFMAGGCTAFSDTIQWQTSQLDGLPAKMPWEVSFNMGSQQLEARGAVPSGGIRYRLFDALGRLVEEGRLPAVRRLDGLPGGWYTALMEGDGMVVPLRIIIIR